jgi:MFS family permease
MINRWTILSVLFLARVSMAFQFQAVAALSPVLAETMRLSLAQIGVLIGLYLAPGLVVAVPGGALAARVGEKRLIAAAMVAMALGALLAAVGGGWGAVLTGRIIAGVGGVVLNVVMTKMVVDWFAGRELSTAMAIYVNSWPAGIALALIAFPFAVGLGGLAAAQGLELAVIALALMLFLMVYRAPRGDEMVEPVASSGSATGAEAVFPYGPVLLAGAVWAFYNAALAMVFSFGPAMLVARGVDLAVAGSLTGLFMLVFAVALPFGGVVADKTGRRDAVIVLSLVSYILLMPLVLVLPGAMLVPVLLVLAVIFAAPAGPIMTLPGTVLAPAMRSYGVGVFWTVYYVVMMLAPRWRDMSPSGPDRSGRR